MVRERESPRLDWLGAGACRCRGGRRHAVHGPRRGSRRRSSASSLSWASWLTATSSRAATTCSWSDRCRCSCSPPSSSGPRRPRRSASPSRSASRPSRATSARRRRCCSPATSRSTHVPAPRRRRGRGDAGRRPPARQVGGVAVVVAAAFLVAGALNYLLVAVFMKVVAGRPVRAQLVSTYVPLLSANLAQSVLVALIALLYALYALPAMLLSMLGLAVYVRLQGELLEARQHARDARERAQRLARMNFGMLSAMLRTLDLRDQMTARHSRRRRPLLAGDRPARRLLATRGGARPHRRAAARHRQVHPSRPHPQGQRAAHRRGLDADQAPPRSRAPASSPRSTATARSRRSSSPTTSGSTARAIRAAWRATTSPSWRADHLRRRHLRRDDRPRLLPHADRPATTRSPSCAGSPANSSTRASSRSSSSCSRARTSPSATARPRTSRRSWRSSSAARTWTRSPSRCRPRRRSPPEAGPSGRRAAPLRGATRCRVCTMTCSGRTVNADAPSPCTTQNREQLDPSGLRAAVLEVGGRDLDGCSVAHGAPAVR